MICGTNVDRMIQADLVSQHVSDRVVHKADVTNRTKDDVLKPGMWPEEFNPKQMLCNMNDGQTIFKDNPMLVFTPLDKDGLPRSASGYLHDRICRYSGSGQCGQS